MNCKYCESEMTIDDIDKITLTSKDIYWICERCDCSCVEKIRPNKENHISIKIWQKGE